MGLWTQSHAGSIVVLQHYPVLEQTESRYSENWVLMALVRTGLHILSLLKHLSRCLHHCFWTFCTLWTRGNASRGCQ